MGVPKWAFRQVHGTGPNGKPTVTVSLRALAVPVLLLVFLWDTVTGKTLVKAPAKRKRGGRRI